MAKFIKIKKENLASSLNYTVDILIGVDQIALVKKGSNSANELKIRYLRGVHR